MLTHCIIEIVLAIHARIPFNDSSDILSVLFVNMGVISTHWLATASKLDTHTADVQVFVAKLVSWTWASHAFDTISHWVPSYIFSTCVTIKFLTHQSWWVVHFPNYLCYNLYRSSSFFFFFFFFLLRWFRLRNLGLHPVIGPSGIIFIRIWSDVVLRLMVHQ